MTDKLPPLSTKPVSLSQSAPPITTIVSAYDVSHKIETQEEEPYTIKCICSYSGDDGNTIFCETCDTWQHIECFYPDNVQDALSEGFAHSCADCKPRPLDRQKAVEHQKSRLDSLMVVDTISDKKPKRPPSKSHKKKPKPNDLQINGHNPTELTKNTSSHDPPPPKKSKTSHKSNPSVSSQAPKRSPPHGSNRATSNTHPPSPVTTPPELPQDFEIHNYSPGFLASHNQKDADTVQTNSFASLNISNTMSLWLREPAKLRQETGQEFSDVFQTLPSNIDTLKRPLRLEVKQLSLARETVARWQYLMTPTPVAKDVPLIELNGSIGFQKDYCADKHNRWDEFSSPLPFVFFHEMLPLYIDTRQEGSRARYVRRSCKPNAVLDTFLSGGSEYHFWLVSDRSIAANEQITIAWDFRFPNPQKARLLHLLGLGDDDNGPHEKQEMDETEYRSLSAWMHLMLSEYGGCACELGSNCAFVLFHRSYHARMQGKANKKKSRKSKSHAVSPPSTGHATNSRAASEGHFEDAADADAASASGSSRSKPPSRDLTPAQSTPAPRQGSFDTLGILTEPTDRDKRKVAMVEDSFRRMEQTQPPRKKKRVSDGSSSATSTSKPKTKSTGAQSNGVQYFDAGTSRSKSGSPTGAVSPGTSSSSKPSGVRHGVQPSKPHTRPRSPPRYCNASVQTEPVRGEWYSEPPAPAIRPRRSIISLSKRLLENRHRTRQEDEKRKKRQSLDSQSGPSDTVSVESSTEPVNASVAPEIPDGVSSEASHDEPTVDVSMPDAPLSPTSARPTTSVSALSSSEAPDTVATSRKLSIPELRVQMPPPSILPGCAPATTVTITPLPALGSVVQSPFSTTTLQSPAPLNSTSANAANPSPIKKKLSLSDYTKSRKAAAGRPPIGNMLKASTPGGDESRSATSLDATSAPDSPLNDRALETLAPSPEVAVSAAGI
ncbi:hypothetical protein MGG_01558 [Pyricularia oryzae 70-15]|uniref:SET domain-containing protein n=1 Tax=Pyricularia oryzae (strain 70-15 / ATCC MYA-4617 / FGSC 8958) TaxID=242507 RepID=G4MTH5_PYRO7|nr:uncharacterized protein MGG_01558 [Pyricularia oryzae 70-15]EHA54726.1 hypothetical protein MGG_01558 [Pyricularia oryzae 70-15]